MARKLKTYTTSAGFFDLAIAAPSMKAALEAWGSRSNLFQHGFAEVSEDPKIVEATMAKPGVVLRRPVGSNGAFSEDAKLPKDLLEGKLERRPAKPKAPKKKEAPPARAADDKASRQAARQAALAFEKEQKRRESERRREETAAKKERERREEAIAAAEAALDEARQEHERKVEEIDKERAALDKRMDAEDARWRKKKEQLDEALRRARSPSHLRLV
jgi:hypothetical protein